MACVRRDGLVSTVCALYFLVSLLQERHVSLERVLNGFEAGKDDALSGHDASQSRDDAGIKRCNAFLDENLPETIECAVVLTGLDALHPSFDHIEGVVPKRAETSGTHPTEQSEQGRHRLLSVVCDEAFEFVEPHEAQTLIGALFESGGSSTPVHTRQSFGGQNVLEARDKAHIEFNAPRFDGFDGCHDNQCLTDSRPESSDEVFGGG